MRNRFLGLGLTLMLLNLACRSPSRPVIEPRQESDASEQGTIGEAFNAVASWYGHPYHGQRTANGEVYDMNLLTAAHRKWPFNTLVRVTHLDSGRKVLVRINDRGPFVEGREIDLSREAARRLGMIDEGTARVRLEALSGVLPMPLAAAESMLVNNDLTYRLQMGAFSSEKNAGRLLNQLRQDAGWLKLQLIGDGLLFRVQSTECFTEAEGEAQRKRLQELGYESILRACD